MSQLTELYSDITSLLASHNNLSPHLGRVDQYLQEYLEYPLEVGRLRGMLDGLFLAGLVDIELINKVDDIIIDYGMNE